MQRVGIVVLLAAAALAEDEPLPKPQKERLRLLEASREKALASVPDLVALLHEGSDGGRAGKVLLDLGEDAVPALEQMVRERKASRWAAAAAMLGRLGAVSLPALPTLRDALGKEGGEGIVALAIARVTADPAERRRMLLRALREEQGPYLDRYLIEELARAGTEMREAAPLLWPRAEGRYADPALLSALWRIDGDAARVLAVVVPAMTDPDHPYMITRWAEALHDMKGAALPGSEAILEVLARNEYCPDEGKLLATLDLTGVDPALVPRLRGWVRTGSARAVRVALDALARAGPASEAAIPDVARLLGRKEPRLREAGEEWLDGCALPRAAIARGLGGALEGADETLACTILDRLSDFGPDAKDAVPAMRQACREPGGRARVRALLAASWIGPGAAAMVPEAVAALEAQEEDPAWAAACALSEFGKSAAAAAPDLRRIMGARPTSNGLWAATALLKVAREDVRKEVARYAGSCLKDESIRARALWTLADTGDAAGPYLDRARGLLKAQGAVTRVAAAYLLASRNANMAASMKILGEALQSGDARAFEEACRAAQRLGPLAKPLEGALRNLRNGGKLDRGQREMAEEALAAIGG